MHLDATSDAVDTAVECRRSSAAAGAEHRSGPGWKRAFHHGGDVPLHGGFTARDFRRVCCQEAAARRPLKVRVQVDAGGQPAVAGWLCMGPWVWRGACGSPCASCADSWSCDNLSEQDVCRRPMPSRRAREGIGQSRRPAGGGTGWSRRRSGNSTCPPHRRGSRDRSLDWVDASPRIPTPSSRLRR